MPCLSAGFLSTALCFAVPALSGVYGISPSLKPICHVHHACLMGSSSGTSPVSWYVSSALSCAALHHSVRSSHSCPSTCNPPIHRDLPKQEGHAGERIEEPRDIAVFYFFYAGRRWSQTEDTVIPETVTKMVLPGL